ncbi:DUF3100 domain-containing protein [Nocardioides sp. KR10-350]|uniref:DUF3100 domain-containing protein n=1 Tax=Nocardioides cheoyonin TaxID=3156615 RepID=UPI0032B47860
MTALTSTPRTFRLGTTRPAAAMAVVATLGLLLTAVSELLGAHTLNLGIGDVTIYPLAWAIILGAVISIQRVRALPVRLQQIAAALAPTGILLLGARLALTVGQNLPVLKHVGAALLLQEVGHLFGTVLFSLPVAVLLKMGRATVGACFSIDREGSFAMVAERHGADSDEYRGVLAMYVFGTIVGALYVSLLASFLAHAGVFDPLALAMGAGVGSGSVMAAATASIASQYPDMAQQALAVAAISNLVTGFLGLYVGMYVALPLAERFYRFLTRSGASADPAAAPGTPARSDAEKSVTAAVAGPSALSGWFALPLMAVAMVLAEAIFGHGLQWRFLVGLAVLVTIVLLAQGLNRLTRLSTIIGVTTIGILVSCPWSPLSDRLVDIMTPVDFLALTTPVLAFAGLGLGKDAPLMRRIGWRVIPVGLVSFAATFVASAAIAELALH